jgi:hypothetical protein
MFAKVITYIFAQIKIDLFQTCCTYYELKVSLQKLVLTQQSNKKKSYAVVFYFLFDKNIPKSA